MKRRTDQAVRQILGAVVRRPEAAKGWSERETRRRVREIASAIGDKYYTRLGTERDTGMERED